MAKPIWDASRQSDGRSMMFQAVWTPNNVDGRGHWDRRASSSELSGSLTRSTQRGVAKVCSQGDSSDGSGFGFLKPTGFITEGGERQSSARFTNLARKALRST